MKKHLLLIFSSLLSLFLIYKAPYYAYLYAGTVFLASCIISLWLYKQAKSRLLIIYLGSIILAFLLAEIYFSLKHQGIRTNKMIYGEYQSDDQYIGLVPQKNSKWTSSYNFKDSLIFEVTQTTDQYGRRIVPVSKTNSKDAVLFFGCSFTFGYGVEDHESMPYQFQKAIDGKYQAFNYGYNSYGAHQMLALLENEKEKPGLENYVPKYAFYQAITDHVFRGTHSDIEKMGPKYRFTDKNQIKKVDMFGRKHFGKYQYYLTKSKLLSRFLFSKKHSQERDISLLIAMIEKSAKIFEERYGGEFYCLIWNEPNSEDGLYDKILNELKNKHINIIEMEQVIPEYTKNYEKYTIYNDGHPNPKSHKLIGQYLADFLDRKKSKELLIEQ